MAVRAARWPRTSCWASHARTVEDPGAAVEKPSGREVVTVPAGAHGPRPRLAPGPHPPDSSPGPRGPAASGQGDPEGVLERVARGDSEQARGRPLGVAGPVEHTRPAASEARGAGADWGSLGSQQVLAVSRWRPQPAVRLPALPLPAVSAATLRGAERVSQPEEASGLGERLSLEVQAHGTGCSL